jgi:glyoxylate reductase
VVVTQPLIGDAIDRLTDAGYDVTIVSEHGPPTPDQLCRSLKGANALVCLLCDVIDEHVLDCGPELRVVSNVAVGVDNIDLDAARARGVEVRNTPGVLDAATADLAMGLLVAVARGIVTGMDVIRRGEWNGFGLATGLGHDLAGMRLGLVGYGRIARKVAVRATAFEMDVRHHARHRTGVPGYVAELDELLESSDAVSLHVPLSGATHGLLDARRLALLPRGAIVINTARGAVLDEHALIGALESGHLGGAGLDVFVDEPNVSASLLSARNVVLTPHIGSATTETRAAMATMAVDNVIEVLAGSGAPGRPREPGPIAS